MAEVKVKSCEKREQFSICVYVYKLLRNLKSDLVTWSIFYQPKIIYCNYSQGCSQSNIMTEAIVHEKKNDWGNVQGLILFLAI